MQPSARIIALTVTGLLISTALPGCTRPRVEPIPPATVAVKVDDLAPADLLVCPVAPEGFPVDATATLPPGVRDAAIRLARAYAAAHQQLSRLINWQTPGACKDAR